MAVPSAFALDVRDVRFGMHPDKTRMVLDLSQRADFRVFVLADPYRMVLDLPDFEWSAAQIKPPTGGGVKDIRQGRLKPGVGRVVLDLDQPVAIKSAFLLPAAQGLPDRLIVDFASVSAAAFAQYKGKIVGPLDVDDEVALSAAATAPSSAPSEASAPPAAVHQASIRGMVIPQRKPAVSKWGKKPLIVIDAGHGGADPGAIGSNGVFEKNVTLAMALTLKKQMEATGRYEVALTRDRDVYIRLHKRVAFARARDADMFISLHADSIGKSSVRGASIYTLSEKASDAQTERLAHKENRADLIAGVDLSVEDEVVANILVDLAMRDTMNQSNFLANTVVSTIRSKGVRVLENSHRSAGFAVLKAPDIPSILIEMGFMSNPQEAKMLAQSSYREKLAAALLSGVDAYFNKLKKNGNL